MIISNSCTNLDKLFLSFLTLAHSRTPYPEIPSAAKYEKYVNIDCTKETLPVPDACKIRATYEYVINGKIKFADVFITLISILIFIDFCFIQPP